MAAAFYGLVTVYAFQIGAVNPGGVPVPAPGFWREWQSAQFYLTQPWPNYLFGQISTTGWWYYFPIALAVKTPLPILMLLAFAIARTFIKHTWRTDAIFLIPMALIFGSLLFSTNNLGYRYLLPLLPLTFVYVARSISPSLRQPVSRSSLVAVSGLVWLIIGTLAISPYYLTYFNEVAGGPERGRTILSDSNLDWGQDLVGLKNYLDRNNVSSIKLQLLRHLTSDRLRPGDRGPAARPHRDERSGRVVVEALLSARSHAGKIRDQRSELDGWHLDRAECVCLLS